MMEERILATNPRVYICCMDYAVGGLRAAYDADLVHGATHSKRWHVGGEDRVASSLRRRIGFKEMAHGRRMTLISCTSPSISTGTLKNETPLSGRTCGGEQRSRGGRRWEGRGRGKAVGGEGEGGGGAQGARQRGGEHAPLSHRLEGGMDQRLVQVQHLQQPSPPNGTPDQVVRPRRSLGALHNASTSVAATSVYRPGGRWRR